MPEYKSAQLQPWLDLLCQMLPGIGQAVLITDSCTQADPIVHWPGSREIDADVLAAARLAASQKKIPGKKGAGTKQPSQMSLFGGGPDPIRDKLKKVKPDDLSPIEALNLLYELKKL